jgi:hypothetical protein
MPGSGLTTGTASVVDSPHFSHPVCCGFLRVTRLQPWSRSAAVNCKCRLFAEPYSYEWLDHVRP